jgi:hypothetical protein
VTTLEKTTISRIECYLGSYEGHVKRTANEGAARHVVLKWGTHLFDGATFKAVDLNGSGSYVAYADLAALFDLGVVAKRHMGRTAPAPVPAPAPAPVKAKAKKAAPAAKPVPKAKPARPAPAPAPAPVPAPAPASPEPVAAAPRAALAVLPAPNTSKSKVRWDRRFFSKVA